MRLSRLRHEDVQPRAQLAHGGSIPRGRQGMHGSTTTRVPIGDGAPGPGLDDAARRLVPEDEGERADGGQGRRRPGVVREEVEVAAADAPGRDGDPGPRRTRELGLGKLGQRGGELGVHHVEHDGAHARERRRGRRPPHGGAPGLRCRTMRVPDATLDEVREHGFSLSRGSSAPDELAAAQDALWLHFPRPEDYFADPAQLRPVTRRASSPAWRSSRTARGTSTAWPSTPTWSTRPSATSGRRSSISTRWSCGPSTPAPSTTTSRCTATTAATASSCRAPSPATSSSRRSSTSPTSPRTTGRPASCPTRRQGRPLHAAVPPLRGAGRRRGALHRPGGEPPRLPDRHPAPRLGLQRRRGGHASRILADFQVRGTTWGGKMAWPKQSPERWAKFIPQCSVRERDLFGFPRPGDPYWNEETLAGVARPVPGHRPGAVPGARALLSAGHQATAASRWPTLPSESRRRKGSGHAGTGDLGIRGRDDQGVRRRQQGSSASTWRPGRATGPTGCRSTRPG